jgi:hypothetical protein
MSNPAGYNINFDEDQLMVIHEALDREIDRLGDLMDKFQNDRLRFIHLQAKRNEAKAAMRLIGEFLGLDTSD